MCYMSGPKQQEFTILTTDLIPQLHIGQLVGIEIDGKIYKNPIICINDWSKQIGYVSSDYQFAEVPYRKVYLINN